MKFLLLFGLIPYLSLAQISGDYSIDFLQSEDSTVAPIFSIDRVAPFEGGLRVFLDTNRPGAVAQLLDAGALEAQLSDNQAETAMTLSLSLGKAVWCTQDSKPVYLGYGEPLPDCDGNRPARIEYYFEVPATLGRGCDLAIGQDPDYLWLIEEE